MRKRAKAKATSLSTFHSYFWKPISYNFLRKHVKNRDLFTARHRISRSWFEIICLNHAHDSPKPSKTGHNCKQFFSLTANMIDNLGTGHRSGTWDWQSYWLEDLRAVSWEDWPTSRWTACLLVRYKRDDTITTTHAVYSSQFWVTLLSAELFEVLFRMRIFRIPRRICLDLRPLPTMDFGLFDRVAHPTLASIRRKCCFVSTLLFSHAKGLVRRPKYAEGL